MAKKRVLVLCAYLRRDRAQGAFREFLQPMSASHVAAVVGYDKHEVRPHYEMYRGPFCSVNAGQYEVVFMTGNDGRAQCDAVRLKALSVRRLRAPTLDARCR
jgi:hypothetical protein